MSEQEDIPTAPRRRKTLRRKLIWAGVVVAVLLALIFTPPLLNANRLKRRIVTSISNSLGRPVHIDNVTLTLLPVPAFTLEGVTVGEDPTFGYEPVIRADSVRATIRASSLWRRQVELGTIRFDSPSVNLVRRKDGRWNLESILIHAAQEDAAPTAQAKAGPAPRFPYIEATGARVNVKLGEEKLPIALTETDFALWLPSPEQWRVRLEAKPTRTNSGASDTGIITAEATLQRAAHLAEVPIEMTATWKRLPLGEATRVLLKSDAGWRGSVEAFASLHGTLGDAVVNGTLKIGGLRRAEFIPAHPLDVNMECTAHMAIAAAVLREPMCTASPAPITHLGFGAVAGPPASAVYATADTLDLTGLKTTNLRVGTPKASLAWLTDFVRLRSPEFAGIATPTGDVSASFVEDSGHWTGELNGKIQLKSLGGKPEDAGAREFRVASTGDGIALDPLNLTFADRTPLLLTGTATSSSIVLRLAGTTTSSQVTTLETTIPPLQAALKKALPEISTAPAKVDVSCSLLDEATCVSTRAAEPQKKTGRHR